MATLVAAGLVAALAWTAEAVGGRLAARWAAWAGFAFASSVMLQAERLNGELAAALFVTLSIGAFLRAARLSVSPTHTFWWGALAGVSAATAVLMKQNFVDAFVFAAVLATLALATSRNRLRYTPSRMLLTATALVAGAAAPAAATAVWASGHGGVDALLYAVVGFRADASTVMAQWSWHAPLHRLSTLAVLSCVSGLTILGGHVALSHRRRLLRLDPLPWAVAATASVEILGVLAGENFWRARARLPVRVEPAPAYLDPQLALLTTTLEGPGAPTWVVRWDDPHTWGLDPGNRVEAALHAHYRAVGYVCGHLVWLHDDVSRPLPPLPDASTCGAARAAVTRGGLRKQQWAARGGLNPRRAQRCSALSASALVSWMVPSGCWGGA